MNGLALSELIRRGLAREEAIETHDVWGVEKSEEGEYKANVIGIALIGWFGRGSACELTSDSMEEASRGEDLVGHKTAEILRILSLERFDQLETLINLHREMSAKQIAQELEKDDKFLEKQN